MWPLSSFANFAVSWLSKLVSADGNVSTYSLLLSSYANFAVSWLSKAVNWGVPTRMVYLYNEYSREISFWSETLEMQIVMLRTCSFVIRFKTWICRKWCEFRVIISHFFSYCLLGINKDLNVCLLWMSYSNARLLAAGKGKKCWPLVIPMMLCVGEKTPPFADNNNNRIDRRSLRFLQSPHCAMNCLPTRTLKWPGHNRVQITCNISSAYHVHHELSPNTYTQVVRT